MIKLANEASGLNGSQESSDKENGISNGDGIKRKNSGNRFEFSNFIDFCIKINFKLIEIDDIDSDDGVDIIGGVKADSLFDNKKSKAKKKKKQKQTAAQQLHQEQVSFFFLSYFWFLFK